MQSGPLLSNYTTLPRFWPVVYWLRLQAVTGLGRLRLRRGCKSWRTSSTGHEDAGQQRIAATLELQAQQFGYKGCRVST